MKDLVNAMTVEQVRQGLIQYSTFQCEIDGNWLDSKAFVTQVLIYANEMNWSVNEIIAMYKKVNGLEGK